ncbi:unnamed protein product, partial [Staurois parvus]
MQLPVLNCTFLTLSERKESTAENWQLSEQELAPIIRALMISTLMIGAQQCHPPVPPTCAQQCRPPVPNGATHQCTSVQPSSASTSVPPTCAQPPVPSSATHLCPPVPINAVLPVSAQRLCQSVPSSCTSQCLAGRQSVPSSDASQCHLSV